MTTTNASQAVLFVMAITTVAIEVTNEIVPCVVMVSNAEMAIVFHKATDAMETTIVAIEVTKEIVNLTMFVSDIFLTTFFFKTFLYIFQCTSNQFKCLTTHLCIRSAYVCDNDNDCSDASDEANCGRVFPFHLKFSFYYSFLSYRIVLVSNVTMVTVSEEIGFATETTTVVI